MKIFINNFFTYFIKGNIFLLLLCVGTMFPKSNKHLEKSIVVHPSKIDAHFYSFKTTNITLEIQSKDDIPLSIFINSATKEKIQILSNNRSWLFSKSLSKYIFKDLSGKLQVFHLKKNENKFVDIIFLGEHKNTFTGTIQFYSLNSLLYEVPINIKPEPFFIDTIHFTNKYFYLYLLGAILLLLILIQSFKYFKRFFKNNNVNKLPSVVLNEFICFIHSHKKVYVSSKRNPFNCHLPFINIPFNVILKNYLVVISYKKKIPKIEVDLKVEGGYYKTSIDSKYEIELIQEHFETLETSLHNKSLILLKIRSLQADEQSK